MYYGRVNAKNPSPHRFLALCRRNNDSEVVKSRFSTHCGGPIRHTMVWEAFQAQNRWDSVQKTAPKPVQECPDRSRHIINRKGSKFYIGDIPPKKIPTPKKKIWTKKIAIFFRLFFSSENLKFRIFQKIAEIWDFGNFDFLKFQKFQNFSEKKRA